MRPGPEGFFHYSASSVNGDPGALRRVPPRPSPRVLRLRAALLLDRGAPTSHLSLLQPRLELTELFCSVLAPYLVRKL